MSKKKLTQNGLKTGNHKIPRKKQVVSSLTLVLAMIFLDLTPKAKATKPKINKWESGSRLQSKNILNSPPLIDTTIL